MKNIGLLNKLIKSTRRWSKKTNLSFFTALNRYFLEKKKQHIFDVLNELNVLPENAAGTVSPRQTEKIVWVCWFQGIEQAPILVKRCVESIQNNVGDARVVILDDENIKDYISLPAYIIEKYQRGLISKAHYSDIVRCSLLAQYGGVWMDATVYLTRRIPDHLFYCDFSSLRFNEGNTDEAISLGYWTAYFLASQKNAPYIVMVRDLFYQYWQKHDALIEYFLIDYTLLFGIEKFAFFKEMVEEQPVIGNKRFYIRQFINEPVNADVINKLNQDPVGIYKLSHKARYSEAKDSDRTLYGRILDNSFTLNSSP
ncbi:capsular polysaccharide synthesis protein [Scandinavium manionii]|uniref:capsular polysaccharide synthesis protein n=1 Tax=Scandinavium manionii TaxID=2926520 RepID=UPI00216633BB|nr:capsular polysaccharide synthesis protein [Scandinavium manionii]MCS2165794.1 capsular polysaccharide synthesis protein [Scandinavium manionii]